MPQPPAPRISLHQFWWLILAGSILLIIVLWQVLGPALNAPEVERQALTESGGTNGFKLDSFLGNRELVAKGAASRSAIPPLVEPPSWDGVEVESINKRWRRERHMKALVPNDPVIGVELNGKARAFPICILNWHEVVDTTLGGEPIAVTYCPLTASAAVYARRADGITLELAATGLLYNSNTLLYDRQALMGEESLYCQLTGNALSGGVDEAGTSLERIPFELTLWGDWLERHPASTVLSLETGFTRDYEADAYGNYYDRGRVRFPVDPLPVTDWPDLMERCIAVPESGGWAVYPHSYIIEQYGAGQEWRVHGLVFNVLHPTSPAQPPEIRVTAGDGKAVDDISALWFALYALLPDARLVQQ